MTIKRHKGRVSKIPKWYTRDINPGYISIVSEESFRYTVGQFKSFILTLKRSLPGKATINPISKPHYPVTKKPLEVRMGKGKGNLSHRIARVRPNTIILELGKFNPSIPLDKYINALKLAATKLPIKWFISTKKTKTFSCWNR